MLCCLPFSVAQARHPGLPFPLSWTSAQPSPVHLLSLSSKHTSISLHSIVSILVWTSFIVCRHCYNGVLFPSISLYYCQSVILPSSKSHRDTCLHLPDSPSSIGHPVLGKPSIIYFIVKQAPPIWRSRTIPPFEESRHKEESWEESLPLLVLNFYLF